MDENHQSPQLENVKQFIRSHQNTTKFLLSVSVISIFFSHSNFSDLLLKLVTHTIDKNFMFLFCNGLLVLLAKYSRLSKQNPSSDYLKSYEDVPQMALPQIVSVDERMVLGRNGETAVEREDEVLVEEAEQEKQTVLEVQVRQETDEVQEEEEAAPAAVDNFETTTAEQEEDEVLGDDAEEQVEEEDVVGEGSVALLSTEELNKRFDEFIRKMKEELRIEARQQLIIV